MLNKGFNFFLKNETYRLKALQNSQNLSSLKIPISLGFMDFVETRIF